MERFFSSGSKYGWTDSGMFCDILRHERSKQTISYPPYEVSFEQELEEIEKKIAEIETLVASYLNSPEASLQKKLETKFVHIFGRVDHLSTKEEQVCKVRSQLLQKTLELESQFVDKGSEDHVTTDGSFNPFLGQIK